MVGAVLRGENDGVDVVGLAVFAVGDGDLRFGVRAEAEFGMGAADFGLFRGQFVRDGEGERHQFRRLVDGVAEHQALIARALLFAAHRVHSLRDVGGLLLNGEHHAAGGSVHAQIGGGVADIDNRIAHHVGDLHVGFGREFAADHAQAARQKRFEGHAGTGVLLEQFVQNGVADLVGKFIRVAFGDAFGREENEIGHERVSFPTGTTQGRSTGA